MAWLTRGLTAALVLACSPAQAQVVAAVARPYYGPTALGPQSDSFSTFNTHARPISDDGRYVAFLASGSLGASVGAFIVRKDLASGAVEPVTNCGTEYGVNPAIGFDSYPPEATISGDGTVVAFTASSFCLAGNAAVPPLRRNDIFVRDFTTGSLSRVSVASDGAAANATSLRPAVSADGRYVAFWSAASNLVPGDTNGGYDVFVRDRTAGTTTRVSVATGGVQMSQVTTTGALSISGNGRVVGFSTAAANLVAGDDNGFEDIFVHDRIALTTTRASVGPGAVQANGPSAAVALDSTGTAIAFTSDATNLAADDTNGFTDTFVRDATAGTTTLVSRSTAGVVGNGASTLPSISSDGRYVAFQSAAGNFDGSGIGSSPDAFVRDRTLGTTQLASPSVLGTPLGDAALPWISGNAQFVVFYTGRAIAPADANGQTDVYRRNLASADYTQASVSNSTLTAGVNGDFTEHAMSADGRYLAFESWASNLVQGDSSSSSDLFWVDRGLGTIKRINVSPAGALRAAVGDLYAPAMSATGRYVAFQTRGFAPASETFPPMDVYRRDTATDVTTKVSLAGGFRPQISSDGRYVFYLTSGVTRWDANDGSRTTYAEPANGFRISRNGRYFVFWTSFALLPEDTNNRSDVYLIDTLTPGLERVSVGTSGLQANNDSYEASISDDGRFVLFVTTANNLRPGDSGTTPEMFLRDRLQGVTTNVLRYPIDDFVPPVLTPDARSVAFRTQSSLGAAGDTYAWSDAYSLDLFTGERRRVSIDAAGRQMVFPSGVGSIFLPIESLAMTPDGRFVSFTGDGNPLWPVYGGYRPGRNLFVSTVPTNEISIRPGTTIGTGDDNDNVGQSIAAGFGIRAVGAPNAGVGSTGKGAVYLYLDETVSGGSSAKGATPPITLSTGIGQVGDKFGRGIAVSRDGSTVVVGAPGALGNSGRAYVFRRPVGGWVSDDTPNEVLAPDAGDGAGQFGEAVAVDETGTILVGAPMTDGTSADSGVAYSFRTNEKTRIAPNVPSGTQFGTDLDAADGTIVIGAPGSGAGQVFVYESSPNGPVPMGAIGAADGNVGDKTGTGVSTRGGEIVVGRPGRGGRGGAVIFRRFEGQPATEVGTLDVDVDTGAGSNAGMSVAIGDGIIIVGAPNASVDGRANQGRAYVYEEPANGWPATSSPQAGVTPVDGALGDQFGTDVTIDPSFLLVGAPYRDVEAQGVATLSQAKAIATDQGAVITYSLDRVFRSSFE